MHIVVLDGYAMNPGDLSWAPLEALGDCQCYDYCTVDEVVTRAVHAEIIVMNKVRMDAALLASLPKLKFISLLSTGYDILDVKTARDLGIPVSNVPAYSTPSVAQTVMAHLLNLTQQVGHHAQTVREGKWFNCPIYCYWDTPLVELDGKTMGIVGWGHIGQATARLARAFGMQVLVATRTIPSVLPEQCELVDLDELFSKSDVVSLHCPLTDATKHMVNAERLAIMKPTAFLINTSRGGLIDEPALAEALHAKQIAGAGLDVLSREPALESNPLINTPHCFITPHLAWATQESRQRLLDVTAENVRAFLAGSPKNVVN